MARTNLRLIGLLTLGASLALASRGAFSVQRQPAPRPGAVTALFETLKPRPADTAASGDPALLQRR